MKRWILPPLAVIFLLGAWVWAKAPSDHALRQACVRFQENRRRDDVALTLEERYIEAELRKITDQAASRANELREQLGTKAKEREAALLSTHRFRAGRWDVLLVPRTALTPARDGAFKNAGSYDVSTTKDAPALRGRITVWLKPQGWFANWVQSLGIA
ncbi:MAG: hypothetical protein V3T86_14070 [Planctomycetota bacterium]